MSARTVCSVALLLVLAGSEAAADPVNLILPEPRTLCKDATFQVCRELPPGRFLDADTWQVLDLEVQRLQTVETRLTAENKSLRKDSESWQPGWKTLLGAFVVGATGGAAAYRMLR